MCIIMDWLLAKVAATFPPNIHFPDSLIPPTCGINRAHQLGPTPLAGINVKSADWLQTWQSGKRHPCERFASSKSQLQNIAVLPARERERKKTTNLLIWHGHEATKQCSMCRSTQGGKKKETEKPSAIIADRGALIRNGTLLRMERQVKRRDRRKQLGKFQWQIRWTPQQRKPTA